ncbi:MAG TPA: dehydrogenase [Oceanospirillaceae bacterium]|nr:dehydrogenase [Oceanospirillaceae bacterium]
MRIGFIGLGNMGSGMASNLQLFCAAQGHELLVSDLDPSKVQTLLDLGAKDGGSVANIASQADLLFTSLPSSKEVNLLAFGEAGILANAKAASTWIETSTNELAEWEKVKAAAPACMTLIDGPVTGGAEGAAAGTLTMLMGVSEADHAKWAELLDSFTNKARRMGTSGAGYVTKLAQLHLNYLVAQGIGEALMLGAKANLELHSLHEVLQTSCAQSYVVDAYIPKLLDGSYDQSFALGLAAKDMRLINQLADHLHVQMPLGSKVYETYQQATAKYGFDAPHLSVVRLIEEDNDTLLR